MQRIMKIVELKMESLKSSRGNVDIRINTIPFFCKHGYTFRDFVKHFTNQSILSVLLFVTFKVTYLYTFRNNYLINRLFSYMLYYLWTLIFYKGIFLLTILILHVETTLSKRNQYNNNSL